MIGNTYWATSIVVTFGAAYGVHSPAWSGRLDFFDDGFADDSVAENRISTEGQLRTRYSVEAGNDHELALGAVIDTLIKDAARLNITFVRSPIRPTLYYRGDGEDPWYTPSPDWREILSRQCARIGWRDTYPALSVGKEANA